MSSNTVVDSIAGAVEHCETMSQLHEDLAADYYQPMQQFLETKRWHQLTLTILDLVNDPTNVRQTSDSVHSFLALYDQVVCRVEKRLHSLSLARIAASVALSLFEQDITAAKAVLENLVANKKDTLGPVATIYVQSQHSLLCLQSLPPPPSSEQRKEALDAILAVIRANAATLNEILITDPVDQAIVNAAHFEQAMMYYKIVGPAELFYEQAIRFLHYAPLPTQEGGGNTTAFTTNVNYPQLAVDLSLAALTADGVYNLGQVLESAPKPLILSLRDSPDGWLVDLLRACADGDIAHFDQLTEQHAAAIQKQPALVHRATAVKEKLTLLALVKIVFAKPAHERTLTFQEIAEKLMVAEDQVEWIIMRALSVKLIKGSLDQVDQTLQVTWVLPRILNKEQLEHLSGRYGEWAGKVGRIQETIQDQTLSFA